MSADLRPEEIEAESFRIIDREVGEHSWPEPEWQVVRRAIHTSADFEYAASMVFSPDVVSPAVAALRDGTHIVTDTKMAMSGINKSLLGRLGINLSCFVSDADVAGEARRAGLTRSVIAMRKGIATCGNCIYIVGNAPTALFELLRQIRQGAVTPRLVVGLPVGFVGAAESKERLAAELAESGIPFITNRGRKGGSNVAAAVVNALLLQACG